MFNVRIKAGNIFLSNCYQLIEGQIIGRPIFPVSASQPVTLRAPPFFSKDHSTKNISKKIFHSKQAVRSPRLVKDHTTLIIKGVETNRSRTVAFTQYRKEKTLLRSVLPNTRNKSCEKERIRIEVRQHHGRRAEHSSICT